jgi:TRAP-type C4-dicarboxylate transport system substrate-binding protein
MRVLRRTTVRLTALLGAGAFFAAALGGCTAPAASPELVVLSIGTNDLPESAVTREILHFAQAVKQASSNAIVIEPQWGFGGEQTPHWDQIVGQAVIVGDLDMAAVPTRAWDALGVTSLRALNAPFVVTHDNALIAAAQDDLAGRLLAGLSEVGVTGLAILPESLRHPNSFGDPLYGAEDYAGAVIRSPYSETVTTMFEALGATTAEGSPEDPLLDAMETSFTRSEGPVVTGNVTFFGKLDALVINDETLAGLTDAQRDILATAAAETRDWVIENLPTDRDLAEQYCASGGTIVAADDDQYASLVVATAPVMTALQEDPVTADLIGQLRAVPSAAGPITACP